LFFKMREKEDHYFLPPDLIKYYALLTEVEKTGCCNQEMLAEVLREIASQKGFIEPEDCDKIKDKEK